MATQAESKVQENAVAEATTPSMPAKLTTPKELVQAAEFIVTALDEKLRGYSDNPAYIKKLQTVAINAVAQNPTLMSVMKTSQGQFSFKLAVCKAAECGLQADGVQGAIVAYKDRCQFQPMVRGLVEVIYRTGLVSGIYQDKVCENDDFVYNMGRVEKHQIDFRKPRGKCYGYWVSVKLTQGDTVCKFMTVDEVQKVRKMSKCPDSPAWTNSYDEMAYKTVLRNLIKRLPTTEALSKVVAVSDEEFDFASKDKGENKFLSSSRPTAIMPDATLAEDVEASDE